VIVLSAQATTDSTTALTAPIENVNNKNLFLTAWMYSRKGSLFWPGAQNRQSAGRAVAQKLGDLLAEGENCEFYGGVNQADETIRN
jgi:hypothetical protein